jgi:hypothetical protein
LSNRESGLGGKLASSSLGISQFNFLLFFVVTFAIVVTTTPIILRSCSLLAQSVTTSPVTVITSVVLLQLYFAIASHHLLKQLLFGKLNIFGDSDLHSSPPA